MSDQRDFCLKCSQWGHLPANCKGDQWPRSSRVVGLVVVTLLMTSAVAQSDLSPDQAAQCEAEGGCTIFTRDALVGIIRMASKIAFKQGLKACNSSV